MQENCDQARGGQAADPLAVPTAVPEQTHLTDRWVTFTPHWLTVSIRESLEVVQARVAAHFLGAGEDQDGASFFDQSKRRPSFYAALCEAKLGITIASGFIHQAHDHCQVNVPGSALEQLPRGGIDAVAGFLGDLLAVESDPERLVSEIGGDDDSYTPAPGRLFKVTRLDLAYDGVPFSVADCVAAAMPGLVNLRSPVKRGHGIIPLGDPVPGEDGATFHWGSRSSDRSLRVYDRRGPVRLELEVRRDKSDLLARDLLARPVDAWASRTIQYLRDFIDFVDRSSNSNISRAALLPWWAQFVQGAQRIKLKVERAPSALVARVVGQVKRQRRTITKAVQAFGLSWLQHHAINMGNVVLTPRDRREIEELRDVAKSDPDAVGLYPSLRSAVTSALQAVVPQYAQMQLAMR